MQLGAVVTDESGKPITGLQPWDFTLLDNGKPSKIHFFRAFHRMSDQLDPSLEVLLVLDALNSSGQQQAIARTEMVRYLEQNRGRLPHPVTLMVLSDKGLEIQPRPSSDGKREVKLLRKLSPRVSVFNSAMGLEGEIERFNLSLAQVRLIAENESHKPGRKLLVWLGSEWPLLETRDVLHSVSDSSKYFDDAVELSNWLMEGQTVVCTVSPLDSTAGAALTNPELYKAFLKPVLSARDASSGNLAPDVLAVHSGGQVLGPGNDLAEQISRCIEDADHSYQLTFEPAKGQPANAYHALKLTVDQPGVTVRTSSGYYTQP
jgi:VWFA-related protein